MEWEQRHYGSVGVLLALPALLLLPPTAGQACLLELLLKVSELGRCVQNVMGTAVSLVSPSFGRGGDSASDFVRIEVTDAHRGNSSRRGAASRGGRERGVAVGELLAGGGLVAEGRLARGVPRAARRGRRRREHRRKRCRRRGAPS